MNFLRFFLVTSSMCASFTLTQIGASENNKNRLATNLILSNTDTTTNQSSTTIPIANAWNWSGYLQNIQKTFPLGTPDRKIIDKTIELLQNNQAPQAKEYVIEEYKAHGDYDGLISFLIGFFNVEGIGGTKDLVEGFNFMKKSAKRGFAEGEYQLGRYYANGIGTPTDTLQAALWYKAASQSGHQEATTNLKYLFIMEMVPDEWIISCESVSESTIKDKLIQARRFYHGYTDAEGHKVNPDLQQALNELNDLVPNCVNPPQEQS